MPPSFSPPNDVDAPVRRTTDTGALSTPVLSQAPPASVTGVHQMAVPRAPSVGTYTGAAQTEASLVTQPVDPPIL